MWIPVSRTSGLLFAEKPCLCEGVEPVGNVVMKKTVFTVETISAGMGEVLVYVEDPAGHREEVRPELRYSRYRCLLTNTTPPPPPLSFRLK